MRLFFYSEISRYSPGFSIINPEGMSTQRIAPSEVFYIDKTEADRISIDEGQRTLRRHLQGIEDLNFNQSPEDDNE